MLLFVTAVAVVLVTSFLCSIFESVLLSVTRPQIEVMIREEKSGGRLLAGFKENMDVPIAAILILNTSAHTVGAAVAGASYSSVFDPATLWVFSIIFTLAVLLFTEIIPKTLGVTYATVLASPVAHAIQWLSRLLHPLVWLSERLSRSMRGDAQNPVTSLEEIRLLALLGHDEGVVGPRTTGMIVGATQLRHLQVRDVMLPRGSVRYLAGTMSREEAAELVRSTGHSRFPFTPTGNLDDLAGVVLAKQLLYWLLTHEDEQIDWEALRQEPLVIPESVSLPQLMRTFQTSHRHLAVVVDEYGDIEGIATLEDVIEEVVGDIRDESDSPADDMREQEDGTLMVRATVDLRRLSARLGVAWRPGKDASSIGGVVTETLERVPQEGDRVHWHGHVIEVVKADRRRARWLRVSRNDATDGDQ